MAASEACVLSLIERGDRKDNGKGGSEACENRQLLHSREILAPLRALGLSRHDAWGHDSHQDGRGGDQL